MGLVHLDKVRQSTIRPLLDAVALGLKAAEAIGRAVVDMWLCFPGDTIVDGGTRKVRAAEGTFDVHVSGELMIPADENDAKALAAQWQREVARWFGIAEWEATTARSPPGPRER
jgi:hypothetical protein